MGQQKSRPANQVVIVASVLTLVVDIVLLGQAAIYVIYTRPSFREIFEDFGRDLPRLTQWVLPVPTTAFLAVFVVIAILLVAKEIALHSTSAKFGLNVAAGLVLLCLTFLLVIALSLPIHDLVGRVAK
jgi:type II secretory pathway component PulF